VLTGRNGARRRSSIWCWTPAEGGSFVRGERMANGNEALRLEQRLGSRARFAEAGVFGRSRARAAGPADGHAGGMRMARSSLRTCGSEVSMRA
jgi:hypothetical protein